jgi:hypothetical protein
MADAAPAVTPLDDGAQAMCTDTWDYIADKGPVCAVGFQSVHDPSSLWFHTFRIFAFKKGCAVATGVTGRYLVNTHNDSEVDTAAQAIQLPALMHFHDSSVPACFGLHFKIGGNGKIYVSTVPTDLKLTSDPDAPDKWVSEADICTRKLDLFCKATPIQNKDGNALAKRMDEWIKNHSPYHKDRNLRSLAACKAWTAHNNFSKQIAIVVELCHREVKTEIQSAYGVAAGAAKKTKKGNSDPLTESQKEKLAEELSTAAAQVARGAAPLEAAVTACSVPVGYRIIEGDFDPELEGTVSTEQLQQILHAGAHERADELLDLLKESEKIALLRQSKAPSLPAVSPWVKLVPEEVNTDQVDDTVECDLNLGPELPREQSSEINSQEDSRRTSKRTRTPADRLGDHIGFTKPKSSSSTETASFMSGTDSDFPRLDEFGTKAKRSYQRSGLYTKDKLQAARKRAGQRSGRKDAAYCDEEEAGVSPQPFYVPASPICQFSSIRVPHVQMLQINHRRTRLRS